jgi:hypothetical protein
MILRWSVTQPTPLPSGEARNVRTPDFLFRQVTIVWATADEAKIERKVTENKIVQRIADEILKGKR